MKATDQLASLNFHDSMIREISLTFPHGHDRKCTFDIDYYNWEGNTEGTEWRWKRLKIYFGYLASFEFSAPDMINCVHEIDIAVFGEDLDMLRKRKEKVNQAFPKAQIQLFDSGSEPVSIKFLTQNGDETENGYEEGFIKAIGSRVYLEWIKEDILIGQSHIPIAEENKDSGDND